MRRKYVATAIVVLTAGLTATAALRRRAARRLIPAAAPASAVPTASPAPVAPVPDRDAVVLTFAPRPATTPVAERPAAPARCGDNGGRTKAGAPCGARATVGGRCHHHRVAA